MELALHITKYPSRESWSHRDLLRLSHPMASSNNKELANSQTLVYDQIFHYACKGSFLLMFNISKIKVILTHKSL